MSTLNVDTLQDKAGAFEHARLVQVVNALDRRKSYPRIEEQLDDIYHNGIDEWKKAIKAVKDKYPKG